MSQSPERNEDEGPATQTPENNDPAQQPNDQPGDEMNTRPEDLGYDFEVKEQDRWLPIANGESRANALVFPVLLPPHSVAPCVPRRTVLSLSIRDFVLWTVLFSPLTACTSTDARV